MAKKLELKTKKNDSNVDEYIAGIADEQTRKDCEQLVKLMSETTGEPAKMWGASMVGFGEYEYTAANGKVGEWFLTGFAPRKQNLTIYIMFGFKDYKNLVDKLGKFTHSKSCIYVKKLEDIDSDVLRKLVKISCDDLRAGKTAQY